MAGLLIVNADDWGGNPEATDRTAECYRAGRVTSATAMVYMADSARAADVAQELALPIGLHLNLTQSFDDPETPLTVRARQQALVEHFHERTSSYTFSAAACRLTRTAIADQLERFRELYGREPSHFDSHNHVHLSPTVLLALPRRVRVRTAHQWDGNARGPRGLIRAARHASISRRFISTDYCFSIDNLHADRGGRGLDRARELSRRRSVEIVVHPDRPQELELLQSDEWSRLLGDRRLGSFAALSGRQHLPANGGQ